MPKQKFEEIIKDFCHCDAETNEDLTQNLKVEKVLQPYMGRPGFKRWVDVKDIIIKHLKYTRIAQRPLLVAIGKIDELIRKFRGLGISVGFKFPDEAPFKSMMGPEKVQDHLSYESVVLVIELTLPDFFDGTVDLSDHNRKVIQGHIDIFQTALDNYKSKMVATITGIFDCGAETLLEMKNLLNFYL